MNCQILSVRVPREAFSRAVSRASFRCRSTFVRRIVSITVAAVICACSGIVHGQAFMDPGFEDFAINSGDFIKPSSGLWKFGNDAGVVEPYSPNSSIAVLNTWSATFSAMQGEQYASTYAGSDTIRQSVSFGTAGDYRLSVYAAAPDGSVTVFPMTSPQPVADGEFTFTLANVPIGDVHTVAKGSSWRLYSAVFSIDRPGDYLLGVLNTKTDSYFINYDAFAVQTVPEPSSFGLMLALAATAGGIGTLRWRRSKLADNSRE